MLTIAKYFRFIAKNKDKMFAIHTNYLHSLYPNISSSNLYLDEYVFKNVHQWEDKTSLICTTTKRSYTYLEFYKKTNALANFLHEYDKIKPSDVVLLVLPNIPEYPIISLGAIRAGLVVSTANPSYNAGEISKQLKNSFPKMIFTLNESYATVKEALDIAQLQIPIVIVKTKEEELIPRDCIDFKSILQGNTKLNFYIKRDLNDTIFLLYSSGTTGMPKAVELTHNNVVSNLQQMSDPNIDNLRNTNEADQEILPAILPLFHCYGLVSCLLNGLSHGCKLPILSKFHSKSFLNLLNEYPPTVMYLVPPIVHFLLNDLHVNQRSLPKLKTLCSGAASLSATHIDQFHEKFNDAVNVLQAYGLTETSPLTHTQTPHENGIKMGSIGYLIPSTEACVISIEDGTTQSVNQSGEILIRGPQVMKGYYNNQEATNNAITNGWFKTGDIGYYDEDGHFFITDRIKELIKVKGYQVAPAELEEVLRNHPHVEDAAVIGIPHTKFGEVPKAFVVPKINSKITESDIQEYVKANLAYFKQLHGGVTFTKEIPKSPTGKILRRVLKDI